SLLCALFILPLLLLYDGLNHHPSVLPSFPTRRSSDLSFRGIGVSLQLGIVATGVAYYLFSKGLVHVSSSTAVTLALAEPNSRPIDRKSTRLNSSHVSISYAVFCLKKKKNTEHSRVTTK